MIIWGLVKFEAKIKFLNLYSCLGPVCFDIGLFMAKYRQVTLHLTYNHRWIIFMMHSISYNIINDVINESSLRNFRKISVFSWNIKLVQELSALLKQEVKNEIIGSKREIFLQNMTWQYTSERSVFMKRFVDTLNEERYTFPYCIDYCYWQNTN